MEFPNKELINKKYIPNHATQRDFMFTSIDDRLNISWTGKYNSEVADILEKIRKIWL